MKLNCQILFSLKEMLSSIPMDKLGKVDESSYKAIVMRHGLVKMFSEKNKEYEDLLPKFSKIFDEVVAQNRSFESDIRNAASKENQPVPERLIQEHARASDNELKEKVAAEFPGCGLSYSALRSIIYLKTDKEVEIDLPREQVKFLRDIVEKFGVDYFYEDEQFISIMEAIVL